MKTGRNDRESEDRLVMRHTLSIIVINYRTPDLSIACLASLLPELAGIDAAVVLVDNDSGDQSAERLRKWIADHDAGGLVELVRSRLYSSYRTQTLVRCFFDNLGRNTDRQ